MTDVFERFSIELNKIIPFDRISIASVNLDTQQYTIEFKFGDLRLVPDKPDPIPFDGSITGHLITSGTSLIVHSDTPEYSEANISSAKPFPGAAFTSYMGVPLKFADAIIGVVVLAKADARFTPESQSLAERIGNLLSGSLANYILNLERTKALMDADESANRFLQIADNVNGGFWLSNLQPHQVLYASSNIEQIMGVPAESFYDGTSPWLDLVHPEDLERVTKSRELSHTTGEMYEEFRLVLEDGSVRWVSNRGFPIRDEAGDVYRMGGFVEDITERKDADLKLSESQRLASIGELSAGVAHEINNPLTSIVLYSQMLLDDDISDSTRNSLQVVSSQAYRAAKIVRNLLQFARKSDPEKRPLSIDGLIRRSLEMKSHEFRVNSISVVDEIPEGLPLIMMDEHLILQVLLNVLTNAEQACVSTHGKGVITVSATTDGDIIDVKIHDDGPGIPPEQLSKIFQPFFTTKETGVGTGLGLSVSHGILSQHEGNIWAESSPESGSTFHIELPLTGIEDTTLAPSTPQATPIIRSNKSTSHVLLVDDEPDLRLVLSRQLELRRYNVDQAGDGEEAWRKLQLFDYDCILLDLRMPGLGGQGLYERIQEMHPELIKLIVFITGDTVNPATKNFLGSVTNPVLSKPFDFRELEQLVVSVIDRGRNTSNHGEPKPEASVSASTQISG
ncbi:MAG: PAS domain-containing protein [Chloroflexi bacterium]|nr:PAS domain-containing protein [Chloroflexota bacterium]